MTDLLQTVNTIRESTISFHYNAALAELEDKIKREPLRTNFIISSGCVSEDVSKEIAHRLSEGGTTAVVETYGFFTTNWRLNVTVNLPKTLVREAEKPAATVDE